jgi:hypothetical protein
MRQCWRPVQTGHHHDTYEVEVSLLRKNTVGEVNLFMPLFHTNYIDSPAKDQAHIDVSEQDMVV